MSGLDGRVKEARKKMGVVVLEVSIGTNTVTVTTKRSGKEATTTTTFDK